MFVYGTLKRNQPNHHVLQTGGEGLAELGLNPRTFKPAKFLGAGHTISKYPLVIASKFNIPYLLDKSEIGHQIQGEIYEVNETLLKILDDFEEHPNYYRRREEEIEWKNCQKIKCWVYFLPKFKEEMLKLEFLSDYNSIGDKAYCSEENITNIEDI